MLWTDELHLYDNYLTGPLPSELGKLELLRKHFYEELTSPSGKLFLINLFFSNQVFYIWMETS